MPIYITAPGGTFGGPTTQSRSVGVKLRLRDVANLDKAGDSFLEVIGEALKQEFLRCTKDKADISYTELVND